MRFAKRLIEKKVFTQKSEGFDKAKIDGDVLESDGADSEAEAFKKKKMYALRAHLEHEFDSVRRCGPGGRGGRGGGQHAGRKYICIWILSRTLFVSIIQCTAVRASRRLDLVAYTLVCMGVGG